MTPSETPPMIASSETSPCRSPIRSSACARCGVSRSGTWPVARYSVIERAPSSAPDEGRAMRSTAASGAR